MDDKCTARILCTHTLTRPEPNGIQTPRIHMRPITHNTCESTAIVFAFYAFNRFLPCHHMGGSEATYALVTMFKVSRLTSSCLRQELTHTNLHNTIAELQNCTGTEAVTTRPYLGDVAALSANADEANPRRDQHQGPPSWLAKRSHPPSLMPSAWGRHASGSPQSPG